MEVVLLHDYQEVNFVISEVEAEITRVVQIGILHYYNEQRNNAVLISFIVAILNSFPPPQGRGRCREEAVMGGQLNMAPFMAPSLYGCVERKWTQ